MALTGVNTIAEIGRQVLVDGERKKKTARKRKVI
jgi:hypothetical protein